MIEQDTHRTPTLTAENIEALRGALDGIAEGHMIQVRADVLRVLLPDPAERICTDPRCPFDGRHVRPDENALDHCPLAERDEQVEYDDAVATQAEEPIEDRLQRAFCNGFIEGVRRGSWGRFDHS